VYLAGRERDYGADRVNIFATAKYGACGAVLYDAKDVLIMRVRREALPSVSGAQQLERLEHAHARHRC
jgi:hypothetical protein